MAIQSSAPEGGASTSKLNVASVIEGKCSDVSLGHECSFILKLQSFGIQLVVGLEMSIVIVPILGI